MKSGQQAAEATPLLNNGWKKKRQSKTVEDKQFRVLV